MALRSPRFPAAVTLSLALVAVPGAALAGEPPAAPSAAPPGGALTAVIVRGQPGGQAALQVAVQAAGGRVTRSLAIIDGVAAVVPGGAAERVAHARGVTEVSPDAPLTLSGADTDPEADGDRAPLSDVAAAVRADAARAAGYSGLGVDVAVLDSGVVPVDGLRAPGKVVNGPDLSYDSASPQLRYLDGYGHGTHMAGIVAGRDDALATPVHGGPEEGFTGLAPDARIVNVKVADAQGATDVSQVIAGLDWLVQHGHDGDLDVRVVNLSFGTDGVQDSQLDPLAYAVERVWQAGIVVVVAAGNDGYGSAKLNNPAYDPYVLAVGGSDGRGTVEADDDVVATWSSRGDAARHPDLVAPGSAVVSLRSPGSSLDLAHPAARIGSRFFRGSGTSQATAVVSGAAALLLQQRPELTPDQVKAVLRSSAHHLPLGDEVGQGAGLLDVRRALSTATPTDAEQDWPRARGTGSLDLARGSVRVSLDGVPVAGERSVFYTAWSLPGALSQLLGDATWSGGGWTGAGWSGGSWRGNTWTGNTWTGNTWTGNTWTGNTWTGNTWTGNTWTGNTWTGNTWTGNTWTSAEW